MTRMALGHAVAIAVLWTAGLKTLVGCAQPAPPGASPRGPVAGPLSMRETLHAPTFDEALQQVRRWLEGRVADSAQREQALGAWPAADGAQHELDPSALLDAVGQVLAEVDPRFAKLLTELSSPRAGNVLPDLTWLDSAENDPFLTAHARLLAARWLCRERLDEEALALLDPLAPEEVLDPASMLFYRAVCQQRLLDRQGGLASVTRLLEELDRCPVRYQKVAELLRSDLEQLKDDSLDHIARRMDDIRRRLSLGRSGPKVRQVEDGVIASLDKLIDTLEEQQQQQQEAQGAASDASGRGGNSPGQAAQESRILGGRGPGQTAPRQLGSRSGWGDLPPRARQEALQQIGKDFPPHYREVVEQYFRGLASEESPPAAEAP